MKNQLPGKVLTDYPEPEYTFDGWCFATINNRLAEIYFGKKHGRGKQVIWAHCYVERNEFKTKKEQREIDEDIQKCRFTYRNKTYTRKEIPDQ